MDIQLLIALQLMSLFLVVIVVASNRNTNNLKSNLVISLVAILASVLVWSQMKQVTPHSLLITTVVIRQQISKMNFNKALSKTLINQACDLNQMESICRKGSSTRPITVTTTRFVQIQRRLPELYAAKASALYYLSSQAMSDDVKRLLKQSMDLDPNDRTALMLIATDHFISMRCQQALDAWTQILDSNQKGIIVSLSFIRSTKLSRCYIKLGITSNL